VDRGTTTTVRHARFSPFADRMTVCRVFWISAPWVGSSLTRQISPRRTTGEAAVGGWVTVNAVPANAIREASKKSGGSPKRTAKFREETSCNATEAASHSKPTPSTQNGKLEFVQCNTNDGAPTAPAPQGPKPHCLFWFGLQKDG